MKYPFFVVVDPACPAETTTSCPDQATVKAVIAAFRYWLGTPKKKFKVYAPGDKVPKKVADHVVT